MLFHFFKCMQVVVVVVVVHVRLQSTPHTENRWRQILSSRGPQVSTNNATTKDLAQLLTRWICRVPKPAVSFVNFQTENWSHNQFLVTFSYYMKQMGSILVRRQTARRSATVFQGTYAYFQHSIFCSFGHERTHLGGTTLRHFRKLYLNWPIPPRLQCVNHLQ
jgi:hypothetical protein